MKILITGGAGFIGSHLAEHFQGQATIRILDNLSTGYRKNLDGLDYEWMEGSITDRETVRKAVQNIDYIFHFAAMISVPESMEKPVDCLETNALGTLLVLEEAAKAGVKKLCFSSSAANYGDNPTMPKRETMTPEPKSPYAITKLDGEYYCELFHREGKLNTACMRYFNVFGPRQDPGSAYAAAVPIFIHRALRGESITIYGDGTQTRDFVYVKDVVSANAYLALHPEHTGVYNVAYGGKTTIRELAKTIIDLTGSVSEILYAPERSGDIKHSTAANDKLLNAGWEPGYDFSSGLEETIRFFS